MPATGPYDSYRPNYPTDRTVSVQSEVPSLDPRRRGRHVGPAAEQRSISDSQPLTPVNTPTTPGMPPDYAPKKAPTSLSGTQQALLYDLLAANRALTRSEEHKATAEAEVAFCKRIDDKCASCQRPQSPVKPLSKVNHDRRDAEEKLEAISAQVHRETQNVKAQINIIVPALSATATESSRDQSLMTELRQLKKQFAGLEDENRKLKLDLSTVAKAASSERTAQGRIDDRLTKLEEAHTAQMRQPQAQQMHELRNSMLSKIGEQNNKLDVFEQKIYEKLVPVVGEAEHVREALIDHGTRIVKLEKQHTEPSSSVLDATSNEMLTNLTSKIEILEKSYKHVEFDLFGTCEEQKQGSQGYFEQWRGRFTEQILARALEQTKGVINNDQDSFEIKTLAIDEKQTELGNEMRNLNADTLGQFTDLAKNYQELLTTMSEEVEKNRESIEKLTRELGEGTQQQISDSSETNIVPLSSALPPSQVQELVEANIPMRIIDLERNVEAMQSLTNNMRQRFDDPVHPISEALVKEVMDRLAQIFPLNLLRSHAIEITNMQHVIGGIQNEVQQQRAEFIRLINQGNANIPGIDQRLAQLDRKFMLAHRTLFDQLSNKFVEQKAYVDSRFVEEARGNGNTSGFNIEARYRELEKMFSENKKAHETMQTMVNAHESELMAQNSKDKETMKQRIADLEKMMMELSQRHNSKLMSTNAIQEGSRTVIEIEQDERDSSPDPLELRRKSRQQSDATGPSGHAQAAMDASESIAQIKKDFTTSTAPPVAAVAEKLAEKQSEQFKPTAPSVPAEKSEYSDKAQAICENSSDTLRAPRKPSLVRYSSSTPGFPAGQQQDTSKIDTNEGRCRDQSESNSSSTLCWICRWDQSRQGAISSNELVKCKICDKLYHIKCNMDIYPQDTKAPLYTQMTICHSCWKFSSPTARESMKTVFMTETGADVGKQAGREDREKVLSDLQGAGKSLTRSRSSDGDSVNANGDKKRMRMDPTANVHSTDPNRPASPSAAKALSKAPSNALCKASSKAPPKALFKVSGKPRGQQKQSS